MSRVWNSTDHKSLAFCIDCVQYFDMNSYRSLLGSTKAAEVHSRALQTDSHEWGKLM